MRLVHLATAIAIAVTSSVSFAQGAPAETKPPAAAPAEKSAPAAAAHYSSTTTAISALLADPAAKAVLAKHIPALVNSSSIDQIGSMKLKELQGMAPDQLSDKVLSEVDAELSKLPPK